MPPATWLAESIPASARKLLQRVGALAALDAAGLVRNEGNTVWWAGMPRRDERFETPERGFHADRAALEAVFHGVAKEAGVRLRTDGPVVEAAAEPDGWRVATASGSWRARWVLDASGRAGVLARRGFRIRERGVATLALTGRWTANAGRPAPDPGCTHVESYRDGWAWSVPTSERTRCVTAMVDPRRTHLRRERGLDGMWRAELAKAARLGERLGGGRLAGPVRACPASLYGAAAHGRPGLLLVGDAGSFIDPLSSYGVKKALASAWLAAVVTHTALEDDAMTAPACTLYDEREREMYQAYRGLSVPFLEQAAAASGHPFWASRLAAAREAGADIEDGGTTDGAAGGAGAVAEPGTRSRAEHRVDAFLGSAEVRAAYETIRALPAVRFRRGATLATVERPAVGDDRIALERHLVSTRLPGGARYVRNVDLRRLVEVAPALAQVPDIYDAYNRRGASAPLPDFLAALALALGAGFLDLAGDPARR